MDYRIAPFAGVWSNGIFNVPNDVVDKYLKLASEYQLKALLFILRNNGQSSSSDIGKALGHTCADIDDLMEFWIEEGVLSVDRQAPVQKPVVQKKEEAPKPVKETISAPRLTPKDVISMLRDNKELTFLVNEAQVILGRTISHAEQEMLINMVNYYGLKVEVIMMILEFYRSEKQRGKSIGIAYVNAMAKNWSDEGISSIAEAEDKLRDIERSDRLWNEVVAITGIRHRRPTAKQREMVKGWFDDFDITMITLAADMMKENTAEPSLAYVNSIIKKWKKNGIGTPEQVIAEQEAFSKSKAEKSGDKLQPEPTYDLDNYKTFFVNNTDI